MFSVQEGKDDWMRRWEANMDKTYMDKECIRRLNGLEKSLEKHLPESDRRWTANGGSSLTNSER